MIPSPDVNVGVDSATLRHLQQVHMPVLVAFLTRLTGGDPDRVEEIARETTVRAGRTADAWGDDGRWSRSWLFTTARRILADQAGSISDTHTELPLSDLREVRAALDALPERLRSTLVEIYFRERTAADTADVLDVPAGTVEARTAHALRTLRAELDGSGWGFGPAAPGEHEKSQPNLEPRHPPNRRAQGFPVLPTRTSQE